MPRPSPLSASRIERGSVVSGPCGLLAVVAGVRGDTATLCRVLHRPRYRHRSDVPLGMADSVMVGNVVRCHVFRLPLRRLALAERTISAGLLARIRIAVEKEDAATRWERAERRSRGVSKVYG